MSSNLAVRIEPYEHLPPTYQEDDPHTRELAAEIARLITAGAPDMVVEHVGSTSVAGLGGKGVVDLMLVYPPGRIDPAREHLDRLGFQPQRSRDPFPEDRPMRVGSVQWKGRRYRMHVHVLSAHSPEVDDLRTFRNRLREDRDLRERYARLKREILARGIGDSLDYWKAKSTFFEAGVT